jgi:hypothetical protein
MKFNQIPQRIDNVFFFVADSIGSTKQNLTPYWNSARFQMSDIEERVIMKYHLSREVIFFRPAFFVHESNTLEPALLSYQHNHICSPNKTFALHLKLWKTFCQ